MKTLVIKGRFTNMVLGTMSSDPEIQERFISNKAPDAKSIKEEVASIGVDEVVERSTTIFPRNENGEVFMYGYMFKGFLKNAARALARVDGTVAKGTKAYIKILTDTVFVKDRQINVSFNGKPIKEVGNLQRPLRAQTAQGDRVALANSETIPEGAEFIVTLKLLDEKYLPLVMECLEYGELQGLGQWRNAGFGTFECEVA